MFSRWPRCLLKRKPWTLLANTCESWGSKRKENLVNSTLGSSSQEKGRNGRMLSRLPIGELLLWQCGMKITLLQNMQFAMLQEMMGLGPMKYYIVYNKMPNFFKRLLLLINYLPQKKMCFYPPQVILEPPFDHSPWREIGEAIRSWCFHLKNPLFRVIYFT